MSTPIPPGRGRWRLSLHRRDFTGLRYTDTIIADLQDARSRKLERQLNSSAQLTFTIDGRSEVAKLILELQTDVIAWRWDETIGDDVAYFRGVVAQSEDQLTEQSYTINFTCHDYIAMLMRRYLTAALNFTQTGQDSIVNSFLALATFNAQSSSGTRFTPGSYLPFGSGVWVNPDGTTRARDVGVPLRDRNYTAQSDIGTLLDDLAHVIGGFDYDTIPTNKNSSPDLFRVFYPQQGITRAEPVLEYGGKLATLTRTVNSADYGNYIRVVGNTPAGAADGTPPMFSEAWNADANNVGANGIGLWQMIDSASDVTIQSTLDQKAQGDLAYYGLLVPSYSLTLAPDVFTHGLFNMGDTVTMVVKAGRLNVSTGVRIVGVTFAIGDDGEEDVELAIGRPPLQLADMLAAGLADVNALARR
jgi:hypothetical protein